MPEILTITLNPTVDISTSVPRVLAGPKLRCEKPTADPGGGGINVSRAIQHLGGTSTAFIAVGGATGQRLQSLLAAEMIGTKTFPVPDESRQSFAVTDTATNEQYRFVMPGPLWTGQMVDNLLESLSKAVPSRGIVVVSGSQPPGVPADFLSNLMAATEDKHITLIVDTSGDPLRQLVNKPANVDVLRVDKEEAESVAGHPLLTRAQTAAFAEQLVRSGVSRQVIIARGSDGTTMVTAGEKLHCARPVQKVVSAVGAGDSFVGGFALALSQGATDAEALRHGTAAASAAVMTEATKLCTREDTDRLLPDCELTVL